MQEALPVLLTIEIVSYEKRNQTVYYYIEVMANSTKKWNLERRFKEIEEMHKKLAKKLSDIPYLPAKSIFQVRGEDLDKRKDELEKYFNILACRRDVLSDNDFKGFLELEKHVKVDNLTKVKAISEIQNLPKGVRDFLYLPQKQMLFVLLAEMNTISKIGALISNFSNPKEKEEISSVMAYKEEPANSLEFTRLWKKGFDTEATMTCVDITTPYLAVGFTNGSITCLSLKEGFTKQQEFCKIFCHSQAITGMVVVPETGHLISCSTDKCIIKTDVNSHEGKLAEKNHVYPLTAMILDGQNKRFFVSDVIGSIHIYSVNDKMDPLAAVHFPQENPVKVLSYDPYRGILLSGSNKGIIAIYEIGKPGKEKLSNLTGSFETIKNLRGLYFNPDRKEIYAANNEGNVAFINTLSTTAFHVFEAHASNLNKMIYMANKSLMITASGDKSIKFWRYPYDPKEKLTQKIIDQTGKVIASSDPAQQYRVQKEQEKSGNADDDNEENSPRDSLTLLRYQPAVEVNSDGEIEEKPKSRDLKPAAKLSSNIPKEQESIRKDSGSYKAEEKKQSESQSGGKNNFLFKSSLDQGIKKESVETKEKQNVTVTNNREQSQFEDPIEKRLALINQREAENQKKTQLSTSPNVPVKTEQESITENQSNYSSTNFASKEIEKKANTHEDEDKPLDIEELKKKSKYMPLTFQKKGGESDDEELSGWNS